MKKFLSFFLYFAFVVGSFFCPSNLFSFSIEEDIFNYVKITDSDIKKDSQPIIWIQDLHNDYSAQQNIYNTLTILSQSKDIDKIYMEGVYNNRLLDISLISNIPNKQIKKQTVQNLFEEGILSAGEYFCLNTNKQIYGIEDEDLYLQNLQIFKRISTNKELNNYITGQICSFVQSLKNTYILNSISSVQKKDVLSLNLKNEFPNLQKQQKIIEDSKKIKYSNISSDLEKLLSDLQKNVSVEQYKEISKYLKENTSYGYSKFYDCVKNNIDKYPQLGLFLQSNKDFLSINPIQLLKETNEVKNQLLQELDLNITETEILDLEIYSKSLNDLVNTKISFEQYDNLKKNKNYISYILKKYLPENFAKFALTYLNNTDFYTFYDNNLYRNKIFVKNLLKNNNNKFKVLIAGGFHSGVIDELKKLNKSYIVLTPNISINSAFNELFLSRFNNGTQQEATTIFLDIIKEWGIFFSDAKVFQNEINKWIKDVPQLKDYKVQVSLKKDKFEVVVNFNGFIRKEIISTIGNKQAIKTKRAVETNKYLTDYTLKRILEIAKSTKYFGKNTKVEINTDNSLMDSSLLMPIETKQDNGVTIISINRDFLNAISVEDDSLIQTVVNLLFLCSNYDYNIEEFSNFITRNINQINRIYEIKKELSENVSFLQKIKKLFSQIFKFNKDTVLVDLSEIKAVSEDEKGMIEALKQAELARQSRSYLKTFTQPPVGGYIVDEDGISGRNFNRTDSLLHAETLTIIDYFRNYIYANKQTIDPATYDLVDTLLNALIENAKQLNAKFFYNNPSIFKMLKLDTEMEYGDKRDNNELFRETNLVLKYIDEELLGKPIKKCKLYCTLSPCNKCVGTMCTLKINSLIYASRPANSFHKSLHLLNENGISVTETVLEKEADQYIKNYSRLNASKFGTKIASFIQATRRVVTALFNRINEFAYETLYHDLSNRIISRSIVNLQKNIDWNNINKTTDLSPLETLLKQLNIWDDPIKRAGFIYILRNNIKPIMEKGCIYFETGDGKRLNLFINEKSEVVVSEKYVERIQKLAKTRNIADMDDNLASRGDPFTLEMANIFNNLLLYGIGAPVIVTGNTLEQTKDKRFKSLGITTPRLISEFFTTHGARLYKNTGDPDADIDEVFLESEEYKIDVSKTYLSEDILKALDAIFKPYKDIWYDQFIQFKNHMKNLQQQKGSNIEYSDIVEPYLIDSSFNKLLELLNKYNYEGKSFSSVEEIADFWKNLNREQIFNNVQPWIFSKLSNLKRNDVIEILKALSILEMARVYLSDDAADAEEKKSLTKKGIDEAKDPKYYEYDFDDTRYIISPMRPTFVREIFAEYFKPVIESEFEGIKIASSGQTTININKGSVSKSVPVRDYIMGRENISADQIIYTGDDFDKTKGGVDYPIYELQQTEYGDMFVVSTSHRNFEELSGLTCLVSDKFGNFSNENTVAANIDRNTKLQSIILQIVEERISYILTDENEELDEITIAKELKRKLGISTPEVPQGEVININDFNLKENEGVLKAG